MRERRRRGGKDGCGRWREIRWTEREKNQTENCQRTETVMEAEEATAEEKEVTFQDSKGKRERGGDSECGRSHLLVWAGVHYLFGLFTRVSV